MEKADDSDDDVEVASGRVKGGSHRRRRRRVRFDDESDGGRRIFIIDGVVVDVLRRFRSAFLGRPMFRQRFQVSAGIFRHRRRPRSAALALRLPRRRRTSRLVRLDRLFDVVEGELRRDPVSGLRSVLRCLRRVVDYSGSHPVFSVAQGRLISSRCKLLVRYWLVE